MYVKKNTTASRNTDSVIVRLWDVGKNWWRPDSCVTIDDSKVHVSLLYGK